MEMRLLGRTGIEVSALCLGTMMYGEQTDAAEAFRQMDACRDRGINLFDTAELYTIPPKPDTQGESERIVGRWLRDRGAAGEIMIATKVCGRSPMTWFRDGEPTNLSRSQIFHAIERSLKNLQVDTIDLYQLHWPDRGVQNFGGSLTGYIHYEPDYIAYEETLSALHDLVQQGKIRFFGLSNETPYGTMRFATLAEERGWPRPQSIQNAYNLLNRTFEYGLAEIAHEEQVGLLAYSPLAQGALSGKYLGGRQPEGSRGALFGRMSRYETPSAEEAIRAYVALAREHGLDPSALANQFVTTRPFVTSNIFGATSQAQLDLVFRSLEIDMTPALERQIGEIHARLPNPCP